MEKPRTDGAGVATERAQYSHDLMVKEALAFLDRQAASPEKSPIPEKSRGNKQPFFLYLALTIPHANNEAGEQGMEVPDKGSSDDYYYGDQPWPDSEKGLAAMISRMDQDVGRLMKKLTQLGIDDRTIVFFTSDNGPHNEGGHDASFFHSSGPLRGSKRDLYEGGIRVPMIVRWPGKIEPRSESAHLSYLGDFFATAADLAGTEPPPELDSISLAPTLWGDASEQKEHPYLYWEFYERGSSQAARQGKWKVVRQPMLTGNVELYDLSQDIGEHHDVAAKYHDVAVRMASTLDEAHVASPLWKLPSKPKSVLKAE